MSDTSGNPGRNRAPSIATNRLDVAFEDAREEGPIDEDDDDDVKEIPLRGCPIPRRVLSLSQV